MEVVWNSDKYLSWVIASSRAPDHPMASPSPLPIIPSDTARDSELDTDLNDLVSYSEVSGIFIPSSLLGDQELFCSWRP